jgi:predicted ATPase
MNSSEEALIFENIHEETYTPLGYDLLKIPPGALLIIQIFEQVCTYCEQQIQNRMV